MRFAGQAQLGYYPTPPATRHALASACRPSDSKPWTVCDPFCGPGDALNAFATPYRYGIELDDGRAAQARTTDATILSGNAFDAQIAPHSLSALFLNPPYDYDPIRHARYEDLALRHFVPTLKPHGLVILIFPRSSWLAVNQACMELPLSAPVGLWRFPDPDYEAFQQIVLVAHKLGVRDNIDAAHSMYRSLRYRSTFYALWPLTLPALSVPAAQPLTPEQFTWHPLREDTILDTLAHDTHLQALVQPSTLPPPTLSLDTPIATPMTLHRGHLATLLTAGRLTGVIGEGSQRHLVKGRVVQHTVSIDVVAAGLNPKTTLGAHETQYQVVLTTLHADGTLRTWEPVAEPDDAEADLATSS